ncbi:MAG: fused MFS/spermidine synthase, partial [Clostridiales bacterium]|nr:fused MFS/spermidine synthase [Clostridiales bacterium]
MKKNLFLYATAFFCGMSVMAVELSASRLLAPYFGTSSIIWTIIIGLIMISLSLGNVLGGRSADKHGNLGRLFTFIWIAALWIAVIPLVGKYIVAFSVFVMMWILPNSLLVAGSAFSCLVVFSFPLVLLGMATPYLVKLGITDMENSGKTAGEIYASSTIGSIIGTFIPTFLTIPYIGTQKTFLVFSLVLILICLYYFITAKSRVVRTAISAVIVLALLLAPLSKSYAFWKNTLVEDESLYNYLQVAQEGDSVILSTNVAFGVQSIYTKGKQLSGLYYDYALMAPFFIKNTDAAKKLDVLVLGMGTGTFAKECKYFFPESSITGVEIDSKIVKLSKEYFDLKDEEAKVYVNDGRTFLSDSKAGKYDLVMVDAYHDITIPFHMSTTEFFGEIKQHLNPGGVIMININMRSEGNSEIEDYLSQTLRNNMGYVYKYNIPGSTNTIVYSSDDADSLEAYKQNIGMLGDDDPLKPVATEVLNGLTEVSDTRMVLTDDLAPVEVLGQKVLNEIVADSLDYFKDEI